MFVGDDAFPLLENVMRPYPRRSVTGNYEHQVFNDRLSRARQTVECAFGILACGFRVFRRPFECKVETVRDIVKAACVLYNYLRSSVIVANENLDDIERLPKNQLLPIRRVREQFTNYFDNWGAVPWQHQTVMLENY